MKAFNLAAPQAVAQRLATWVLLIVTAALLICGVLMLARIGASMWLYAAIEDWVTVRLGFDYYLAQFAATTATVGATFVLPAFAWYLFTGRRKLWGAFVPVGGWALIYLLISTAGVGVCFDRRTGAPLCYYADTPRGRIWSHTPGYDPASGEAFKLYTPEVHRRETNARSSSAAPPTSSLTSSNANATPALERRNQQSRVAPNSFPTAHFNTLPTPRRATPHTTAPAAPPTIEPRAATRTVETSTGDADATSARAAERAEAERQAALARQLAEERQAEEQLARDAEARRRAHEAEQLAIERHRTEQRRAEEERRAEETRRAEERRREEQAQRERARRERQRLLDRMVDFGLGQLERRLPRRF